MWLSVVSKVYACWFFVSAGFGPVLESEAWVIDLFMIAGCPGPLPGRRTTDASSGNVLGLDRTKTGRPAIRPFGYWIVFIYFRSTGDRPGDRPGLPDEGRTSGASSV